tara:strand:+ start:3482 stop:3769 length:288 start_codon:yes stop_codon:yes gene_type:complete
MTREAQRVRISDDLYEPLKDLAQASKVAIGDLIFTICESVLSKKKFISFYFPPNNAPIRQVRFTEDQTKKLDGYAKEFSVPIPIILHTVVMKNSE